MPSGNQTFTEWARDREMLDSFVGERGRRLRIEALASQNLVVGNRALAEELADRVEVCAVSKDELLISQGAADSDIYLILSGSFDVIVNGHKIAALGPTEHVGEMAAVQPGQKRSASVVATDNAIVARLSGEAFADLGNRYPQMFRIIAQELARRLVQSNARLRAGASGSARRS
jgi:CRP-like cAMP-binding protein